MGQTLQLTATAQYGFSSQAVTQPALWQSSDPQVAVLSNAHGGRVSALAAVSTTLSASYRGQAASFVLNFAAP